MAKVKISDLDAAATLDGTELVELEQDGTSVKCTTQDIADLGGGGSYLKYVALVSQTGTGAPTATVLENTLGGTVVWTRSDVGDYRATLSGVFTENKTVIFNNLTGGFANYIFWNSTSEIAINTTDNTGTFVDDALVSTSIEIRVYP